MMTKPNPKNRVGQRWSRITQRERPNSFDRSRITDGLPSATSTVNDHQTGRLLKRDHLWTSIINGVSTEVPKPENSVTIEALLQRLTDLTADQENRLVKAVRSLNFELQKLRFAQTTSTAQYNGWLAAAQLKMPECTKLVAEGLTILVVKCSTINVTLEKIDEMQSSVALQRLHTNIDGWELIPFSKCHSQNVFINVNGIPYNYGNSSWEAMGTVNIRPQ